jgi:hypothetical protein
MIALHPYKFPDTLPDNLSLEDHLNGFDQQLYNPVLKHLDNYCVTRGTKLTVNYHQILESHVQTFYPNLSFKFNLARAKGLVWGSLVNYNQHPDIQYKNFLCSFNGTDHVGRKLLVAIINQFGYYNTEYCSKNFAFDKNTIDGHISDYVLDQDILYRKFFISDRSNEFFNTINSFGHIRFNHSRNIYNLEHKLTQSFLHLVSETMATSYVPFVTEKFLYSVVTRGLFLSYAQPGWHAHVEKYYGFKRYTKLFDYHFDSIQNPVMRLVELITMISKFSKLSTHDWHDLSLLETDTIEYNYNHYFSGNYLTKLKQYE